MHGPTLIAVHAYRTGPGTTCVSLVSSPIQTATDAYTVVVRFDPIRLGVVVNTDGPF
jgi:hypothetical protein